MQLNMWAYQQTILNLKSETVQNDLIVEEISERVLTLLRKRVSSLHLVILFSSHLHDTEVMPT